MDGALGSRTAWLHQPYTDDPGTSGVQTFDENRLVDIMNRSNAHGWQINTHAIGDKANTVVLDAIDEASLTSGITARALSIRSTGPLRYRTLLEARRHCVDSSHSYELRSALGH